MSSKYQELYSFVQYFRSILETENVKKSFVQLNNFPHGSCLAASKLLRYYLFQNRLGEFDLILGEIDMLDDYGYHFNKSHAWLENPDFLIDITPDQFGVADKLIVKKKNGIIDDHMGFLSVRKGNSDLNYEVLALQIIQNEMKTSKL